MAISRAGMSLSNVSVYADMRDYSPIVADIFQQHEQRHRSKSGRQRYHNVQSA